MSATAGSLGSSQIESCPELGPICEVRAEQPVNTVQRVLSTELSLSAEVGLMEGWAASTSVPFRVLGSRVSYFNLDGSVRKLDYVDIHHRTETLFGFGDPQLSLRRGISFEEAKLTVVPRLGVSLPLGSTEENPFAAGEAGEVHQHVQFGAGSVGAIFGLDGKWEFRAPFRGSLSAMAIGQLFPFTNRYGYRPGARVTSSAMLSGKVGVSGPIAQLGAVVYAESAEAWIEGKGQEATAHAHSGDGGHVDGNRGRVDLLLDLGAVWRLGPDWTAAFSIRLPVFTRTEGAQYAYQALTQVGAGAIVHAHAEGDH